ncbi:MAG TPA: phenylalanine--tRNA ligase subunit beta [Terrimicrobiaceae bacterium]|nr:phenylalanine--tRNA ligase subunit beta [Terrimicrobiaceae bacterium]
MKVSLDWLREYVDWKGSVEELDDLLTRTGIKVESITTKGANFPNVVIAQILETSRHPNADRLSVCRVADGTNEARRIVCGAKNFQTGDKVPLALPGAVLPGGMKIKVGKLRGVESEGMLCSAKELGLSDDAEGLLLLPKDAPVGEPLADLYPADTTFELEITPNRPDWLSHVGVAREIAAFSGESFHPPRIEVPETVKSLENAVSILAPSLCPLYSARRIREVKVRPSPPWLRDRLEAAGLRPINNIVDVTNYVMLELGQPLHAFDAAKIREGITVRTALEGEKLRALDGSEVLLSTGDLVIADALEPLALAGVMGGEESGVVETTSEILLESALFEPIGIRRSARLHNLHSDSSHRFERGTDPAGVLAASERATRLIEELADGKAAETILMAGALPPAPTPVALRPARCRALLGIEVSDEEIASSLSRLGLKALNEGEGTAWQVPSHRRDLVREVDLIEEIARVIGIERIAGKLAATPAFPSGADKVYDFHMEIRQALRALGSSEARTSTLVSEAMLWSGEVPLRLRNPLGEDQTFLRTSLLPGLLAALARNIRYGARSIALYEIGRTFHAGEAEERGTLAFVIYGEARARTWRESAARSFDWHDAKGAIEELMRTPLTCVPAVAKPPMTLVCDLLVEGTLLGALGQLSPASARDLDAVGPVLVAELSLEMLHSLRRPSRYQEIPKFPPVVRDIAVVCPIALSYGEIEKEIWEAKLEFLEKADPLSVYSDPTGEKLPPDRKSVAISLTFRARGRTLSNEEVNAACDRLKQQLKAKLAVDFRE